MLFVFSSWLSSEKLIAPKTHFTDFFFFTSFLFNKIKNINLQLQNPKCSRLLRTCSKSLFFCYHWLMKLFFYMTCRVCLLINEFDVYGHNISLMHSDNWTSQKEGKEVSRTWTSQITVHKKANLREIAICSRCCSCSSCCRLQSIHKENIKYDRNNAHDRYFWRNPWHQIFVNNRWRQINHKEHFRRTMWQQKQIITFCLVEFYGKITLLFDAT